MGWVCQGRRCIRGVERLHSAPLLLAPPPPLRSTQLPHPPTHPPSGLLGLAALKRRLLPQLSDSRVDTWVTGLTPSAYLHSDWGGRRGGTTAVRCGGEALVTRLSGGELRHGGCARAGARPALGLPAAQAFSAAAARAACSAAQRSAAHHLLRLVHQRVGKVGAVDVGITQVGAREDRALRGSSGGSAGGCERARDGGTASQPGQRLLRPHPLSGSARPPQLPARLAAELSSPAGWRPAGWPPR